MVMIRTVDVGGNGARRADIEETQISKMAKMTVPITAANLEEFWQLVADDLDPETVGIAYAFAGDIENNDKMLNSPNAHVFNNLEVATETTKRTGLKAAVFNDMEAAVTGMAKLLPNEPRFMGITWSSGIGLRFWWNGQILSPAEGGHMVVDISPLALPCGCGKRGCFEAYIGGQALRDRVALTLHRLGQEVPDRMDPCAYLDKCYLQGERWAIKLYDWVTEIMGLFLANIRNLVAISLVVWKGTFALHALNISYMQLKVRDQMKKYLMNPDWAKQENFRFMFCPEPGNDSLIGAAECFRKLTASQP